MLKGNKKGGNLLGLQYFRKKKGLKQTDILFVTQPTVSHMERGGKNFTLTTLDIYCNQVGIDYGFFSKSSGYTFSIKKNGNTVIGFVFHSKRAHLDFDMELKIVSEFDYKGNFVRNINFDFDESSFVDIISFVEREFAK
jgi:transcriptional regulator with XRE-family HTH domain